LLLVTSDYVTSIHRRMVTC